MAGQLGLCHERAIGQAELFHLERAGVGKVLVLEAHALADAPEHHGAGFRQRHLQQHIGAVVGEVKPPALLHVVRAKVHAAPVNDQQELQGIDQAGLARVVGRHQGDCAIQRKLGAGVARAAKQNQALKAVLHQSISSSFSTSSLLSSGAASASLSSSRDAAARPSKWSR